NRLRTFINKVQGIGVMFESDTGMGDIELCPESGKIEDSVKEIKELDLSYLGEEKAKQLRSLLLKYADVFNSKPGCCNTYKHTVSGSYERDMYDILARHKTYSNVYIDSTAAFSMS